MTISNDRHRDRVSGNAAMVGDPAMYTYGTATILLPYLIHQLHKTKFSIHSKTKHEGFHNEFTPLCIVVLVNSRPCLFRLP
jgi:hypothetical protein